ncbi:hypothetical protein A1F99_016190 [Pyrenophora tritici-repentis]|nr:hypothetical protein A1F99_016190 [Pyrenophora tritici-repentis]
MHSIIILAISAAVALAAPADLTSQSKAVELQFGRQYTYKEIADLSAKKPAQTWLQPPPPAKELPTSDTLTNVAVTGEFNCIAGGFIVGSMAAQIQLSPSAPNAQVTWQNVDSVDGFSAGSTTSVGKTSGQQSTTNVAHHDFCRAFRHRICTYRFESTFSVNVDGGNKKISGSAAAEPVMKENCITLQPGGKAECPKPGTTGCMVQDWE